MLKSYKTSYKKRTKPLKDIVTGGITALLGIALVSETSNAVNKL